MSKTEICKTIIRSIKNYLNSPDCLEAHRSPNHFIRKRLLSLQQVAMYLLYSSKASMFQNLSSILDALGSDFFPKVTKQALSKARQGILPSLFSELFNISVDLFYSLIKHRKKWNESLGICEDSIVIFDRGYYAEWLFDTAMTTGIFVLCVLRIS